MKSRSDQYLPGIIEDRQNGMTVTAIGLKYGFNSGQISRICSRLGVKAGPSAKKIKFEQAIALRADGKSVTKIAIEMGISASAVHNYLVEAGLPPLPKPCKQPVNPNAREIKNAGLRAFRLKHKKRLAENRKNRCKTDHLFVLKERVRAITGSIFRRRRHFQKNSRTHQLVGADWTTVSQWIEAKFQPGMTWNNMPLWHVDHEIPLASAKTQEELEKLCHYTNLQPLWAFDNMSKGAKEGFQVLCIEHCHHQKTFSPSNEI